MKIDADAQVVVLHKALSKSYEEYKALHARILFLEGAINSGWLIGRDAKGKFWVDLGAASYSGDTLDEAITAAMRGPEKLSKPQKECKLKKDSS